MEIASQALAPAGRRNPAILFCLLAMATIAHASATLLMEEPYGTFGAMNPTGHAAVYLDHVCADSPTVLRPCREGELGVVISRYYKVGKYDWIAMPLVPYLYGVDSIGDIPATVDKQQVAELRDAYRRAHLLEIVPDNRNGEPPNRNWTELVGASFDRKIYSFRIDSTAEQDRTLIDLFNDRSNKGHFNLLFHNCADFSRAVLDIYLPHAIHRSFIADVGLMTPKQVARSLMAYGRKYPAVKVTVFVIPQVPGTVPRSHPINGIAESLVKSKKYLLPLAVLSPEATGAVIIAYLIDGRMKLPKTAPVFKIGDIASGEMGEPVASLPAALHSAHDSGSNTGSSFPEFPRLWGVTIVNQGLAQSRGSGLAPSADSQ